MHNNSHSQVPLRLMETECLSNLHIERGGTFQNVIKLNCVTPGALISQTLDRTAHVHNGSVFDVALAIAKWAPLIAKPETGKI